MEVRFYRYADPDNHGERGSSPSDGHFRAFQTFEIQPSGSAIPLDKVQHLQQAVIIDSSASLSSILNQPNSPVKAGAQLSPRQPIPRLEDNYDYASFQFRPDGSTDLLPATNLWFLTLHTLEKGDRLNTPPANYCTLQLDSVNGTLRVFRP